MTKTQFATLKWLDEIGGMCVAWRDKVAHPCEALCRSKKMPRVDGTPVSHTQLMPAVSALHLVQMGHIEVLHGMFYITEKGRRQLKP